MEGCTLNFCFWSAERSTASSLTDRSQAVLHRDQHHVLAQQEVGPVDVAVGRAAVEGAAVDEYQHGAELVLAAGRTGILSRRELRISVAHYGT